MLSPTQMLQLAVALLPVLGLFVLAIDQMSSQKSISKAVIFKVMALSLIPAITILGLQGLFMIPIIAGFSGIMIGFVLGVLTTLG